jgi:hypothetical protein
MYHTHMYTLYVQCVHVWGTLQGGVSVCIATPSLYDTQCTLTEYLTRRGVQTKHERAGQIRVGLVALRQQVRQTHTGSTLSVL